MADRGDDWASPSGEAEAGPRYGERVPGWTPPAVDAPAPAPVAVQPPPGTYAPPPRRGLIPLHPLSFGQLLGASFAVIRWNPRASAVPALVITIVQTVLSLGVFAFVGYSAFDRITRASDADRGAIIAGSVLEAVLGVLVVLAISVFAGSLLQGMLVSVVAEGALGRRPTAGQVLRIAGRRIWPLAAVSALFGALQVGAMAILGGLVALLIAFGGTAGIVLGVLLGVLGLLAYGVGYAFLFVKLATVPSAIVLEGLGVRKAIARSWRLLRGSFWRTLGLLAIVIAMVYAAGQLVSLSFSLVGGALGGVLFPNGTSSSDTLTALGPSLVVTLLSTILTTVIAGIGQVAQISAVVLVYLDVRMRREGLDIELQRVVEEGAPGPFPTSAPR